MKKLLLLSLFGCVALNASELQDSNSGAAAAASAKINSKRKPTGHDARDAATGADAY